MSLFCHVRAVVFSVLAGFLCQAAAYEKTPEWWRHYEDQRIAIYEHMKRYGINREDMAVLRRLAETAPPHSQPHLKIASEELLNPGEHLRIEMDEYILTLKIPEAQPVPGQWIWPYTNTRNPDPAMQKWLVQMKGALKVADLSWYMCRSIFPPGVFGRCETAGVSMTYRVLKQEEVDKISTPEKMSRVFRDVQKTWVITQEENEENARNGLIDSRAGDRVSLAPESVIVNGRIWVRQAIDDREKRVYLYTSLLSPNRMLVASFGLPYGSGVNAAGSASPPLRKAIEQMEELIASLRITNTNDDGSPDPFVTERIEPGPLPVREKLPALH